MSEHELLLVILLALPIVHVSVFIHELGHALLGSAAGFVVTSLGVGTARPWCVIRAGRVRLFFCLNRRLPGLTFVLMPQIYPSRWRLVTYTAGGIIANGIAAAFSIVLWRWLSWGQAFWLTAAAVNGSMALVNLIPFHVKIASAPMKTDGALILQALRWGTIVTAGPMVIQSLAALRGLWLSIGDTETLRFYLWAAAGAWSQLDEPDRAQALCAEADALPDVSLPSLRGIGPVVRAGVELESGRYEGAARSLDSAETDYRAAGHAIGLFLVALYRAAACIVRGDAPGGAADLEILQADRLANRYPELFAGVLVTRLRAAIAMSDLAAVERLLSEYNAFGRVRHSASRDLQVFQSVARFHIARGDPMSGEPAYRRALAAVGEVAGMWVDPIARSSFLEGRSVLLAEARQCAETVGRTEEVERLITTILEPPPSAAEVRMKRDRRFRRLAFRVMLGNVVAILAMLLVVCLMPPDATRPFAFLAGVLIIFTAAGGVYRLIDLVVGRFIPRLRAIGGAVMLLLACCPWFCGLVILVVAPIDSRSS